MATTVTEIVEMLRRADEREFAALERSLAADARKGVRKAVEVARKRIEAERAEAERLKSLYEFERSLLPEGAEGFIVGLDEVGRGPVAGPLAVGAVVLPAEGRIEGLNDSKQVKPDVRAEIAERIKRDAVAWAVEFVEPGEIDGDGMSASLRRAFTGALGQIIAQGIEPALVLVDGNPLRIHERERNVVKGDAKCASIAAASIVAKVERDALMDRMALKYPEYGFEENKGYASPHHIEAIRKHGLCEIHRVSFCHSFKQETLF